jgi:hypothetical protein
MIFGHYTPSTPLHRFVVYVRRADEVIELTGNVREKTPTSSWRYLVSRARV